MATTYDVVVIGSGPGGYEAAIRSAQLGMKTAIIERDKLGGVCLNVGCIPTKALLKSAEVAATLGGLSDYGFEKGDVPKPDFGAVIERSRGVAGKMNQGVTFLMKKNKIDVIQGEARLEKGGKIKVKPSTTMDGEKVGKETTVEGKHIILATGARAREIPPLPIDGKKVISYREGMLQKERPDSLLVVGAGAIGVEFAYIYHHMGTKVTIVEVMDRLVPVEDADVSKELTRAYKKMGIDVKTGVELQGVDTKGKKVKATIKTKKGEEVIEVDQVLSAVGVQGNVENLGLEEAGVKHERGAVVVDEFYRTSVPGVYAIGDVVGGPWLAHVASHEGVTCVEMIAYTEEKLDDKPEPINYNNVPGCTYCVPEIASVGYTEAAAKEAGYDIKVGRFPFTASGKAAAMGDTTGFVKVIFDAQYGEWLGCHIIGPGATDMIAEAVLARDLETTAHEVMEAMHPHPTLSEAVMEAARDAYGRAINM